MLLGVLWGEAHLDVALGDHLGGGARQLLRSARRNRRRRGVRRPLHLIIVVLRWQQPVSGISKGWSPAKWGSGRCTGPRASQVAMDIHCNYAAACTLAATSASHRHPHHRPRRPPWRTGQASPPSPPWPPSCASSCPPCPCTAP